MTDHEVLHEVTYHSYPHIRRLTPTIPPAQWAAIYGPTDAMERRYQRDGVPAPRPVEVSHD